LVDTSLAECILEHANKPRGGPYCSGHINGPDSGEAFDIVFQTLYFLGYVLDRTSVLAAILPKTFRK